MPTVIAVSQPMYSTDFGRIVLELEEEGVNVTSPVGLSNLTLFLLNMVYQSACEYSKDISSCSHVCFNVNVDKEIV